MKNHILLVALLLTPFYSSAELFLDEENDICRQVRLFNPWVAEPQGSTNRLIKTASPSYALAGQSLEIKSEQKYIITESFKYRTARDFAYFRSLEYGYDIQEMRDFNSDEDYTMSFPTRGKYRAISIAKDDNHVLAGQGPAGDDFYIPNCDVIEVIAHNRPTISKVSLTGGRDIKITVSGQIDSLSKFSLENKPIKYTYYLINESNSRVNPDASEDTEIITTTSPSKTFRPQTNGYYSVNVEIFDGTYKWRSLMGYVDYNGGSTCSACDYDQIIY